MSNEVVQPLCQICEKKPGFKWIKSKKYKDAAWICVSCLAFGKKRKHFTTKESKITRNDLCPCGSGKKFKKCCISKVRQLKDNR